MADGFLGRWSRRKIAVQEGKPLPDEAPARTPAKTPIDAPIDAPVDASVGAKTAPENIAGNSANTAQAGAAAVKPGVWGQPNYQNFGAPPQALQAPQTPEPEPAPTLDDVQALTPASDFKPFMSAQVSPEVRNAAMKKLFADPHFNIMDGLDVYIDDYSLPDPLPKAMMRQMASAQFLGLFDDENKQAAVADQAPAEPAAPAPAPAPQALSAQRNDTPSETTAEVSASDMLPEPTSPDSPNPAPLGVGVINKNDHA